jgi:hypothetical protein
VPSMCAVLGSNEANDSFDVGSRRRRLACDGSRTPGVVPLIERGDGRALDDPESGEAIGMLWISDYSRIICFV